MNDLKIVFSDWDSTLTIKPGVASIDNKEIFSLLKEKGIYVVINTGRPLSYIIPFCKKLSTSNYVIASNGAEIYDYVNDEMIYKSIIRKELLEKLDDFINKYHLYFMANSGTKRYSNKSNEKNKYIIVDSIKDLDNISQVVLESYSVDDMNSLKEELKPIKELIIANQTRHVVKNKLLYFDIVNSNVSKGVAVEIMCKHLKVPLSKTIGFGDSGNDVEMLKRVNYKVAVANATDEVKNIANIITLSNDNNGVEKVLRDLYKELKEVDYGN